MGGPFDFLTDTVNKVGGAVKNFADNAQLSNIFDNSKPLDFSKGVGLGFGYSYGSGAC